MYITGDPFRRINSPVNIIAAGRRKAVESSPKKKNFRYIVLQIMQINEWLIHEFEATDATTVHNINS